MIDYRFGMNKKCNVYRITWRGEYCAANDVNFNFEGLNRDLVCHEIQIFSMFSASPVGKYFVMIRDFIATPLLSQS
jgi:hypothetical protein